MGTPPLVISVSYTRCTPTFLLIALPRYCVTIRVYVDHLEPNLGGHRRIYLDLDPKQTLKDSRISLTLDSEDRSVKCEAVLERQLIHTQNVLYPQTKHPYSLLGCSHPNTHSHAYRVYRNEPGRARSSHQRPSPFHTTPAIWARVY